VASFAERAGRVIDQNQDMFIALQELDRTGKLRKLSYKERVNFTIDEALMNEFRNTCRRNNRKMSSQVEELIRHFLQHRKP
jgi:hypothetical protein